LPPELGGSLQQANTLEWLQQQIEQQAQEQRAAEESRAKHAAGATSLHSFVLADEEDAALDLTADAAAAGAGNIASSVAGEEADGC
jgi:hypothetical protein